MRLDRSTNINTNEYWDGRYQDFIAQNQIPAIPSVDKFFRFGFIPADESVSILDIGCGTATHYPEINKRYPKARLTGADLSTYAFQYNVENYPFAHFIKLDIEKDPIPFDYDYIISAHTFEHLNDPVAATEKCIAHAHRNVIICVPYRESWAYDHEHMHTFSETEPYTNHDYYLVEYDVPHQVGGIYFRFNGTCP